MLKFVEEHFPRLWIEMNRMREGNQQRFRTRMQRIMPDIIQLMDLYHRDPQMGSLMIRERQLDMQIRHAAFKFHKTEDTDAKQKLRKEIRGLVEQAVDVQLERRELEISSLESRLAELRSQLAGQKEIRDELIKQRARQILTDGPPRMRQRGQRGKEGDAPPFNSPPND